MKKLLAALLAVLLGPWAATLVLTAVLAVQAIVFQDGGAARAAQQRNIR
jgi:ABC-type Co2+ transport system permease subunit